jgi:hypothetical protein
MRRLMRRGVALPVAALLLLSAVTAVLAQDSFLGGKLRTGESVTVPAGETVDGDLYLLTGSATMDGTVDGDLVVFAGRIDVNGTVTGDLLAGGGMVVVNGTVQGDVRTAGGQVTIGGTVGEDVLLAGGQATISAGASIGGDLMVAGGTVDVNGAVSGGIEGRAGTYSRGGTVGGAEHVVITPRVEGRWAFESNAVLDAVRHFIALILFGALLLWLLPHGLRAADATLRQRPLVALGGGLLTIVAFITFVIVVILLMVLLAIIFGLARLGALVLIDLIASFLVLGLGSFVFLMALAFLGDIVVSMALGRLVMSGRLASRSQELGLLAGGAALVVIVTSLPVIGGWAKFAVILFGVGAAGVAAFTAWRNRGGAAPVAPSPMAPPPVSPPPPGEPAAG